MRGTIITEIMSTDKLPFDKLAEEVAEDSPYSEHPSVEVVAGNEVTNDPDCPGLVQGTMEMLAEYIRRYAEISDELDRRELNDLIAERDEIKTKVKEIMYDGGPSLAFDETSGWEASLSKARSGDVWNMDNLRKILTKRQLKRYVVETVSLAAVQEGLANGDLQRSFLEQGGAVSRVSSGSRALSIRERKKKKGL